MGDFPQACLDREATVADTLSVRKVKKDPVAQAMARKRWKGKTKAERLAASRVATAVRSQRAAERRWARLASTTIAVGAPLDLANVVHVGPEHPAALAFEEKLRTHKLVLCDDGRTAEFVPREPVSA